MGSRVVKIRANRCHRTRCVSKRPLAKPYILLRTTDVFSLRIFFLLWCQLDVMQKSFINMNTMYIRGKKSIKVCKLYKRAWQRLKTATDGARVAHFTTWTYIFLTVKSSHEFQKLVPSITAPATRGSGYWLYVACYHWGVCKLSFFQAIGIGGSIHPMAFWEHIHMTNITSSTSKRDF